MFCPSAAPDPPMTTPVHDSSDALIAATFALMSAWASSAVNPEHPANRSSHLLVQKIVGNLRLLREQSDLNPRLCVVMGKIEKSWFEIGKACGSNCKCPAPELLH